MKNILESFLSVLEIRYTRGYAKHLYNEHPHRDSMYGLKKMLDVYGVKTLGVRVDSKDLSELNYPCILHIHGDFVIGQEYDANTIGYLQRGKKTIVTHDDFMRMWTGNALVVKETTEADEPEYSSHRWCELLYTLKACFIPVILLMAVVMGMISNHENISEIDFVRIVFSFGGLLACIMLMEKQLFGTSRYGDKVCSLFHHADCNSILDGPMAKVFGISWSEVGLGYFVACILLLSLFPTSSGTVAIVNCVAMPYGIWSIYYQWRIAKSWCVLCVITQIIIWTIGITSIVEYQTVFVSLDKINSLFTCMFFAISIMLVHHYATAHMAEVGRVRAVQRYRAMKANVFVAKAIIEGGEYYETTLNDSSIIFGNPYAKMRVTILSNPHCNPCAKMHQRVEKLLNMCKNEICVQYIFSSFTEKLEDSSRYLISCYMESTKNEALRKFALWYSRDKFNYKTVIANKEVQIHKEAIEREMERHLIWRNKTSLIATPTILVNGHKLPSEYELEDLVMVSDVNIAPTNILQDVNGRSTTPLGAEPLSAEETV